LESLHLLGQGFLVALQPMNLFWGVVGVVMGTVVGILPGLGPAATVAMLLPATIYLNPGAALIMLTGIYYGAQYGGSTTSILLNIPGESASVVTCFDGYPLAKQGKAGQALAISAIGSFVAGTIGLILIVFFAPALSQVGVSFGPPELFLLMIMAMVVAGSFGESLSKGMVAAATGLMFAFVGADPISGINRFVFGVTFLYEGFDTVAVIVGLFAVGEVFMYIGGRGDKEVTEIPKVSFRSLFPPVRELITSGWAILRGSLMGFCGGFVPGIGVVAPTFISYSIEKRISRHPEKFGHGAIEGVAAPESCNNSAVVGALLPMFTLGIPGSGTTAILLAGLVMWGLQPGPMLMEQHPEVFWPVIASLYIANFLLLVLNLPGAMLLAQVSRVPVRLMMPFILGVSLTGVYAATDSIFGPLTAILFGGLSYLFRRTGFPLAPLSLGLVLGKMMEQNLRRSIVMFHGSFIPFFTRPLCLLIIAFTIFLILISVAIARVAKKRGIIEGAPSSPKPEEADSSQ
jgi:putative tricarboxylic transport membrane protein